MKRLRLDQPFGSLLRTNSGAGLAFPLCHFPAMGRRSRIRPSWCSLWLIRNANGRAVVPCGSRSRNGRNSVENPRGCTPAPSYGVSRSPAEIFVEKVELWLAWKRVAREVAEGTLGG